MFDLLAIDPGANPGFAWFRDGELVGASAEWTRLPPGAYDALVIEDQHAATHIYRNGKRVKVARKSQQTLSFTAGRLFERFDAAAKYRIPANAWRRVLWPGAVSIPKRTVLARLVPDWADAVAHVPAKNRPDVLEAIGIGLAWLKLSVDGREAYRAE